MEQAKDRAKPNPLRGRLTPSLLGSYVPAAFPDPSGKDPRKVLFLWTTVVVISITLLAMVRLSNYLSENIYFIEGGNGVILSTEIGQNNKLRF